jgi:tetratricopeptide (TPR) repeat protein
MMIRFFNSVYCLMLSCALIFFAGCATQMSSIPEVIESVPTAETMPSVPETPAPIPVYPEPVVPVAKPAVVPNLAAESLVKQARTQYYAQDYQGAIVTAERGLRINRQSADLYLVLAQSYLQLALPQKATVFVQQGLRYAPQGSSVAEALVRVKSIIQGE